MHQFRHIRITFLRMYTQLCRKPAPIVHIMIIHSGLKRSTRPPCDFNYGAIVGTRRRHCSLFFLSHNANSNFLFDEVACRRRSRSLQQQSEKASAPLKAPRCGGSCTQDHLAWRRKEDFLCGSETMRGSALSFAPASWLLL